MKNETIRINFDKKKFQKTKKFPSIRQIKIIKENKIVDYGKNIKKK